MAHAVLASLHLVMKQTTLPSPFTTIVLSELTSNIECTVSASMPSQHRLLSSTEVSEKRDESTVRARVK
ncbi:unnamed protein product [Arabis nemorensis]|uniref:Uncharacterized protein n=1 Tax=Arabis nemorensis TaxID=586526 RepID=A0A565B1U8_9BRAS|nr:unnamed protein product [Arabis nemorensis]